MIRALRPAACLLILVSSVLAGCGRPASVRVEIAIHYSGFEPAQVSVPSGVPITFVLVNQDPIDHEWLIGDEAFHQRHRTGTEAHHDSRPDEISVPALASAQTTITFAESGRLAFICHLPGHEAYGMVGTLTVT